MKKRLKMKKMKNQEKKCNLCNGHGSYEDSYDDMYGNNYSLGLFECYYCGGIGRVNLLKELRVKESADKIIKSLDKLFKKDGK